MAQNFLSDIKLGDNIYIRLGDATDGDLQLYHGGLHSFIDNQTGNLYIRNFSDDKNIHFQTDDGSGAVTDYIVIHGQENIVKFQEHSRHLDNKEARFGTGSDLKIYHENSTGHSYIKEAGTGDLRVLTSRFVLNNAADTENMFRATQNGAVELYYDAVKQLETDTNGVEIINNLGVGRFPSPIYGIYQEFNSTDANQDNKFAYFIDGNFSGADNTDGDREQGGIRIDIDSSADGDASDEHRLYGIWTDVRFTGYSDLVRAGYFYAENNNSTGSEKQQETVGVYASAVGDGTNTNAGTNNLKAVQGQASVQNVGYVGASYGGFFQSFLAGVRTADANNLVGVRGEVEIDSSSSITLGNARAVQAVIDVDNTTPTITNSFLYHGTYEGDTSSITNRYGLFIQHAAINRIDGTLGIAGSLPVSTSALTIKSTSASSQQSAIDIIQNGGTNSIIRMGEKSTDGGRFHMFDGGTEKIAFYTDGTDNHISAGNLGIGTENPARPLEVNSSQISARFTSSSTDSQIELVDSGGTAVLGSSSGAFLVQTGSQTRLTISTSGNATFAGTVTANGTTLTGNTGTVTGTGTNNRIAIWNGTTAIDSDSDFYVDGDTIFTTNLEASGNVVVAGNLQVNGTTTTVNQTNLDVADNIIGLNRGLTGTNANDSGIIIERGSSGDNAAFVWDESIGYFSFGTTQKTPSATGAVANESDWTWKPIKASGAVFTGSITSGAITASGDITLDDNSGASPSLYLYNGDNNYWRIFNGSSLDLTFRVGTVTKFSIDSSGDATLSDGTAKKLSILASTHDTNTANTATLELGYGHSGGTGVGNIVLTEDANNSFGADMTFGVPHNNGSGGSSTRTALTLDGGTLAATFEGKVQLNQVPGAFTLNENTGVKLAIVGDGGDNNDGLIITRARGNQNQLDQFINIYNDGTSTFVTSGGTSAHGTFDFRSTTDKGDTSVSRLSINASGNATFANLVTLGPGTTGSPYDSTTFLHVKGTTRSIVQQSSTTDAYYMFGDAAANNVGWFGYNHTSGNANIQAENTITLYKPTNVVGTFAASDDFTLDNSSPEMYFKTGSTHYNWMIAAQENVDTALEFTPSNAVGATGTHDTPALTLYANRNATFAGDVRINGNDLEFNGAAAKISGTSGGQISLNYNTTSNQPLIWYGGGTSEQFKVTNAGVATFAGDVTATGNTRFIKIINNASTPATAIQLASDSTGDGQLRVNDSTGTTKIFFYGEANNDSYINNGGNLGLGTNQPLTNAAYNKLLHIHSSGGLGSVLKLTDTTTGAAAADGLEIIQYAADSYLLNREDGDIKFYTNGSFRGQFDNSGIFEIENATASGTAMYIKNTTNSVANTKTLIDFRAQASDNSPFYVSGQMGSKAEGTWTSTSSTRDASLIFNTVLNGNNELALTLASDKSATFAGSVTSTSLATTGSTGTLNLSALTNVITIPSLQDNGTFLSITQTGNEQWLFKCESIGGGTKDYVTIGASGAAGQFRVHEDGGISAHGNSDTVPAIEIHSDNTHGMRILHRATDGDFSFERRVSGTNTEFLRIGRSTGNATFASDITVNGGDVNVTKQNDAPIFVLTHDGTNPGTSDHLWQIMSWVDYNGTHENWGNITHRTTSDSAVRTELLFDVKSQSGNIQNALTLRGGSGTPNATFGGDVTLAATKKLFLDGGGNTYIQEVAGDDIDIVAGGNQSIEIRGINTNFGGDVTLAGTKSLITNSILTASGDLDIKTVLTSRDIRMYDGNNKVAVRVKGDGTGTDFRNADTRFISLNYEDSVNTIKSHAGSPNFGIESLNIKGDVIRFYTDYDANALNGNLTLTLDSSHNATFTGIVGMGSTGIYAGTNAQLNLPSYALAIKNNVSGSDNNWSYVRNTATGNQANLEFTTGVGISLTLNHDKSATFAGNIQADYQLLGRAFRGANRGELHLNGTGTDDVAEIFFGHGSGYTENNIRWAISDRGTTDGNLKFYRGPANGGFQEQLTLHKDGLATFAGAVNVFPSSLGGSTAMSDGTLIFGAGSTSYYSFRLDSNADLHLDKVFGGTNATVFSIDRSTTNGDITFAGQLNSGRLFVEQSGADMIDMTRTSVGTYRLAISSTDKFSVFDVGASADRLVIDSSGKVGIGTDTPERPLHVLSSVDNPLLVDSSDDTTGIIFRDNNASNSIFYRGNGDYFYTNSQKFGIGTGTPSSQLHLYRNDTSTNELLIENDGTGDAALSFRSDNNTDGNNFASMYFDANDEGNNNTRYAKIRAFIEDNAAGAEDGKLVFTTLTGASDVNQLILDSSGATFAGGVGVGGITPGASGGYATLVANGTSALPVLALRSSSGKVRFGFYEGGAGRFYIDTLNGSDGLAFIDGDGSSERLRIDSSGRFFLGHTSTLLSSSEKFSVSAGTNGINVFSNSSTGNGTLYLQNTNTSTTDWQTYLILQDGTGNRGQMGIFYNTSTLGIGGHGGIEFKTGATSLANATTALTIDTSQNATFAGNVELGDSTNISMSSGGAGQLQVEGSGYTGAIALNATAMYIYHNSSIRDLVLGTNETARLTIAGNSGNTSITGTFTAAGDVVAFSDERLKSNIETLDGSKVYDMRGVSFTKDNKDGSGVIAQELEKVAPELVNNDGEYKSVAYGNITGYLIEAIKDLKAEVEELKNELKNK